MAFEFIIRPLDQQSDTWVIPLLQERWGSTEVVSCGILHDASRLPGFVAWGDETPMGLITYNIVKEDCEIVTLDSLVEEIGIGTALIAAVLEHAKGMGCRRVWLITTNDNLKAMCFYQRRGFHVVAVHSDVIKEYRKIKPSIPETGMYGIPIRDEIKFEILL
jgi:GNAT superfamily N-acetyltransferase